ncbi:circadian clock protein KaiB [Rhizobium sp. G21]|nr:circadian clock protein KaiB [Rhizobium sp. G21]
MAGNAPNSQKAVMNLRAFCDSHVAECYEIEIVDLFDEPQRALSERVLLTPMLAVTVGGKTRRIAGDLSETSVLIDVIGGGAGRS